LPGVPDAVVETVSYIRGLGEHALLDHARHGPPTRSHPNLFTLNIERIVNNGSCCGHHIDNPMGSRVKLVPVIIVYLLECADGMGSGDNIGKTAGLGVPLTA